MRNDALSNMSFTQKTNAYIHSNFDNALIYLRDMAEDGKWEGIDYQDTDNDWDPLLHLDRLLVMTFAYSKKTTDTYHDKKLLAGISKSIEYWYEVNPKCNNWYKNDIAKQFYLNIIALLLENQIEKSLHTKLVSDLTPEPTMTGSNRSLLSISSIYRGVLENNSNMVEKGIKGVLSQIKVSVEEGIQPDYSFHQHGNYIYNGTYGIAFLRESLWLASIVHDSEWAFPLSYIETLRNYYLLGMKMMIYKKRIDYNVIGRAISLKGNIFSASSYLKLINYLEKVDPEYLKEYQVSREKILMNKSQHDLKNKHFWRSDYTSHSTSNYQVSLRMCSKRTIGTELNINNENLLGFWLPFGLTFTYRTGDEYKDIFPVWDWAKLPGVTSPYYIEKVKNGRTYVSNEKSFVGGVSDGFFGISVMDFEKMMTKAKKSWFWFEDEYVSLGTSIESWHDSVINTTINQSLAKQNIRIDGHEMLESSFSGDVKWVLHDSIGYVFPTKSKINISSQIQTGNPRDIYGLAKDTTYRTKIFTIWYNHGIYPKKDKYCFITVPKSNEKKLKNYIKKSKIKILANNDSIQAVHHKELKITSLVIYHKGRYMLDNMPEIVSDSPCLLLYNKKKKMITISDPTAELESVTLEFHFSKKSNIEKHIILPTNADAGKSISIKLKN
jgi:chondroitin AC lyase